jgi:hypothetical protein
MRMAKSKPATSRTNGKKLAAKIQVHLRLYDEYDRSLCIFIQQEAHKNERSVQQQLRYMLRQAAGGI